MDDYEDQESEETEQPTGFASLPKETQAELKKLRKESESLRTRLKERDQEVLTAKYGEDIVSMIPDEVTTYERRAEVAAIWQTKLAPSTDEPEQTEPAAEAEVQEAKPKLAAVVTAPASGTHVPGELLTTAEIKELAKNDPIGAARLVQEGKFVKQDTW